MDYRKQADEIVTLLESMGISDHVEIHLGKYPRVSVWGADQKAMDSVSATYGRLEQVGENMFLAEADGKPKIYLHGGSLWRQFFHQFA